jgi:endonuclease YncB( thermonuclease family)
MRKPKDFDNHPASYAHARSLEYFRAFCHNVTDGDTFDVLIDLGIGKYAYEIIRLQGLDTAEIFSPKSAGERAHGLAAKARTAELILEKPVLIKTFRDAETFGRYVADVFFFPSLAVADFISLADTLRAEGFAKREAYP